MHDVAVTEAQQVLHRQVHALVVGGPDDVHGGGPDRTGDDDGQLGQLGGGRLGAEKDERLAAILEEPGPARRSSRPGVTALSASS